MNFKKLLAAALGMAMASSAFAYPIDGSPFLIDVDQDFSGNASTQTGSISTLGTSRTLATSFYFGDPNVVGTQILDTNINSIMAGLGFAAGSPTAIDGETTVDLRQTNDAGDKNIVVLNPTDFGGSNFRNGFTDQDWFVDDEGWGLTFDYAIDGEVFEKDNGELSVRYTGGFFDIYLERSTEFTDVVAADRLQVLRMVVEGSRIADANLDILGTVQFDDAWANTSLVQNFFVDIASGRSFYEIASETGGAGLPITWRLDTNVDPPIPTEDQLVQLFVDGELTALVRQTELNSTVRYEPVPEPGVLILLGTGLLFLGVVATTRRRRQTNNDLQA